MGTLENDATSASISSYKSVSIRVNPWLRPFFVPFRGLKTTLFLWSFLP
jgi:hypothetical protein